MAKTAFQKLKVLHIIRFLVMNSDENHPVKISDIIAYLAAQGISAERKSIYNDMDALRTCGYNIIFTGRGNGSGYYLDDRNCDEIELKLLPLWSRRAFGTTAKGRECVTIRFENRLAEAVQMLVGSETCMVVDGPDNFVIQLNVVVGPAFFAWVSGFGSGAKIVKPAKVVEQMRCHISAVAAGYSA